MSAGAASRWADLRARFLSSVALLAIAGVEVWLGGTAFHILVMLICGVMMWELGEMTGTPYPVGQGVVAALCLGAALFFQGLGGPVFLAVPVFLGVMGQNRLLYGLCALVIMISCYGLVLMRDVFGLSVVLWLLSVVAVSDMAGYLFGRLLGGPKFWPQISPKKTWSGTVAGWVGACLVGAVFVFYGANSYLLWLSPLVAFAGQMGDIGESALKRRMGVKDSSNLIPGHGGVLDRFDAVMGAVCFLMIIVHMIDIFPHTGF